MNDGPSTEALTQLLIDARDGDAQAYERVYEYLYAELKDKAHGQLARRPSATLSATALVNEAYLRLFDVSRLNVENRQHFLGLCVSAMRHILVDYHRARHAEKRGGDRRKAAIDVEHMSGDEHGELLLEIDEALQRLAQLSERMARVVEYKYFLGLTEKETADVLEVSERTVRLDWQKARAWLAREMRSERPD